jgi:hypothetical protein
LQEIAATAEAFSGRNSVARFASMVAPTEAERQALARWADFPVDREPRPVVLTEFDMNELDAIAGDQRWRTLSSLPAVPESELPDELRDAAVGYCHDARTGERQPLARLVRGNGPFATDRGPRELPAWMMFPEYQRRPFVALDPEFGRRRTWWPDGLCMFQDRPSTLAADGRTLTYRFVGTPAGYADFPTAEVFETETAVVVRPVMVNRDRPNRIRADYLSTREVVVRLAAPLGNRVLVWKAHGANRDTCGTPRTVLVEG